MRKTDRSCHYQTLRDRSIEKDPEIFIIGGGVSLAGEIIIEPIKKYFSQYAFNTEKEIPFAAASLGNDAGIYGAAEFVTANIKEEQT